MLGSALALALTGGLPLLAQAATPAPGTGPTVIGSAPSWVASATKAGTPAAGTVLHLSAVLNLHDGAGAEALALAVSTPGNAQYGHFLTAAQWRSRYAPRSADVTAVRTWLTQQGLHVEAGPANNRYVPFSGTVSQVSAALGTHLATFTKDGAQVTAPTTSYAVPSALAATVAGVAGLDGSDRAVPLHIGGPETASQSRTSTAKFAPSDELPPPDPVFRNAGPCSTFYGEKKADMPRLLKQKETYAPCGYEPPQLRGAYGVDAALAQGYDGRGATVAVVDAYASPYIVADATQYARRNDPSHPLRGYQLTQSTPATYTDTDACGASGWYGEETLDVEAVHAMAPAADILYVGARSCNDADLGAAVNSVIDNSLAQVVTNSYGESDADSTPASDAIFHQSAVQAAAQGISLIYSSGDSGDEIAATGTRQTDEPASDPLVTAVGGTALAVSSDTSYAFEQGWGTGKTSLVDGAWSPTAPAYLYGGGGGTSLRVKQPAYQQGVVPNSISHHFGATKRAVPDVAMVGDPNTGFLVGQRQTFPDGSVRYSEYRIGGTSLAAPLFAGVVAVADQVKGGSLGFLNPKAYSLAGTTAFRDVDHGRRVTDGVVRVDYANGFNDSDGILTSLRTLNQTGSIFTRPGYDDVTGVGSPRGLSFLTAMAK